MKWDSVCDHPYGGVDLVEPDLVFGGEYDPFGAGAVTRKGQPGTVAA